MELKGHALSQTKVCEKAALTLIKMTFALTDSSCNITDTLLSEISLYKQYAALKNRLY